MTVTTEDLVRPAPALRSVSTASRLEAPPSVAAPATGAVANVAPSLAEQVVATIPFDAPRLEHQLDLDHQGQRAEFLAEDGSEGVEWRLDDGSFVQHTELHGWSAHSADE